jgi:hypothetical protein
LYGSATGPQHYVMKDLTMTTNQQPQGTPTLSPELAKFQKVFEPMLTTKQAAAALGCSVAFLNADRLKSKPNVPFIRIGGMIRYRLSELATFIEQNSHR